MPYSPSGSSLAGFFLSRGWHHLIGGVLIACGYVQHVPAPIFKGFTLSNFGEIARAIAVHGCAAVCCSICHVGKLITALN
jgi:hypothetical protein